MADVITLEAEIERKNARIAELVQDRQELAQAIEGALAMFDPSKGEYLRGMHNGLITALSVCSGCDHSSRLLPEPTRIIVASTLPPGNA